MKVSISLLTVALDRLGGLSLRLGALIRALAELGHEIIAIQTPESRAQSAAFYRSVGNLPVSCITVDSQLGKGVFLSARLPLLWLQPWASLLPHDLDLLDLWDPLLNLPSPRSYPIVFSHNHFSPYIWQHLRRCGPRSLGMFPELPFLHAMLRGSKRQVDGYITETNGQRRWLMETYAIPDQRVTAIPPGFDAVLVQQARQAAKRDSTSSPAIVFSGRLHKWKGVFELVEAFSLLSTQHPQWDLHFVGDGPAQAELEKEVAERDLESRVIFWGRKRYAEALRIVASAQVFVLPSYIESFPLGLLEAMAMGVPAIATDVGGIREHMIQPGATGLLIAPKDSKALHQALIDLLSDDSLRLQLGASGRKRVQDLTFERMARSTADFYARVLNNAPPASGGKG